MLGLIVVVVIGVWFFVSARSRQRNPWAWTLVGVATYAATQLLSFFAIWLTVAPAAAKGESALGALIVALLVSICLGVGVAAYVHEVFLASRGGSVGRIGVREAIGLVAVAVLFFSLNITVGRLVRGARVDLTEGNLYTLSAGARAIAQKVDEPITLTLYYSEQIATELPDQKSYATRVQEVLHELERAANGKINVKVINPEPSSDAEDTAMRSGLAGLPTGRGNDRFYLGLVGENSTNQRETVPYLDPSKEEFLEYDLTRTVYVLSNPQKKTIGVMAQLPVDGMQNYPLARGQNIPAWKFMDLLRDYFTIKTIKPEEAVIPPDVKVLLLIHPKNLTDKAWYAIDQFVLGGGRLVVFADPWCQFDVPPGIDRMQAMQLPKASKPEKIFDAWGIELVPGKFVGDHTRALRVPTEQGPMSSLAFAGFLKADMATDDPVAGSLNQINVALAGAIRKKPGSTVQLIPLIESTDDSMLMEVSDVQFMANAPELLTKFKKEGQKLAVAARVRGIVSSAFPAGDPAKQAEPGKENQPQAGHLAQSKEPIDAIVVADCDLLADPMWLQDRGRIGNIHLGYDRGADNGDLVVSALDNLSGSTDLLSMRGRARLARPFSRIEAIQKEADQKTSEKVQELRAKVQAADAKLRDLASKVPPGTTIMVPPEVLTERARLEQEKFATRKELREIEYQRMKDVQRIGSNLKIINIGLMPVLVGVFAVGLGAYRANRRRAWSRSIGSRS